MSDTALPGGIRWMEGAPPDDPWSALPGSGHGFVRRSWQPRLAAAGLNRTDDFFAVTGEVLGKPGLGRRYRARLSLGHGAETEIIYLKRYGGEGLRNWLRRWFEDGHRTAVAEREVRVAALLAQEGVPAVEPIAWGWQGAWGPRQRSFVVMAGLPGKSLERWLEGKVWRPTRDDWRLKRALADRLASLVRRFHASNWRHRDLYLCHVFIVDHAPAFALTLLDLARVFRPRVRRERWLVKDLAQLLYSAQPHSSRSLRMRFLHHYFNCRKLSAAQRRLIRRIQAKRDRIAWHAARKRGPAPGPT